MRKMMRSQVALAVLVLAAGTMGFAETGESIYKANCQSCHGSAGTPNPGIAKMMGVKPAAEYKTSEEEQVKSVKEGKWKRKPFAGKRTDAQVKEVVKYFRTLK